VSLPLIVRVIGVRYRQGCRNGLRTLGLSRVILACPCTIVSTVQGHVWHVYICRPERLPNEEDELLPG
jgi:hypothetical protein